MVPGGIPFLPQQPRWHRLSTMDVLHSFELFALDAPLDVLAVGASPPQTRAMIAAAMAGHVRGKAALVGLFKRAR